MFTKKEYPRPQFKRDQWLNLNGEWEFDFDDGNLGVKEEWYRGTTDFGQTICVPFVYQSKASMIGDTTPHDIVWYKRSFDLDIKEGQLAILHFGAVDYVADIYINGNHVRNHVGGNTSFHMDITPYLKKGTGQQLVVRAYDPHDDESIPRGKQFWEAESRSIWYTNSTGIWQTVWLEVVSARYLEQARFTPLFDEGRVRIEARLNRDCSGLQLNYTIAMKGTLIAQGMLQFVNEHLDFDVELIQNHIFRTNYHEPGFCWTPENPNLFDVCFQVIGSQGEIIDEVKSYFGLRKVHTEKGMVYLNNKPYYQKLVLDQGYWPDGLMTAGDDEALKKDIILAKEMGFNGCRKHQKTEDPRFLYWADKLGYLVWGECAATAVYTNKAAERLMNEWTEIIERDYNHPCIITWVPLNESWGVPAIHYSRQQQHFSQTMYHYLHALDTTRLVVSNDGWDMTETDICAVHNYSHGEKDEPQKYQCFKTSLASLEGILKPASTVQSVYAGSFSHQGEPVMLTEFGGIGFAAAQEQGWGYTSASSEDEFVDEYKRVMEAVFASGILWGFCYTQLCDVEQEINGLLTYERNPKCDIKRIRTINEQFHPRAISG